MPQNFDEAQAYAATRLDALALGLDQLKAKGFFTRLIWSKIKASPRGLYIWGSPGRGKTMLMDDFFARVQIQPRLRVHFHSFMQDVHAARMAHKSDDVIADVAESFTTRARLLCLDEMQVEDIADAMILGRLFEALWSNGVVIVITSNQPPDELYREGLNRALFLPFVARLKRQLELVHVGAGCDYRLRAIAANDLYLFPLGHAADVKLDQLWAKLNGAATGQSMEIPLLGRKLHVPHAANGCARFSFNELCWQPLGAPDYLALAKRFHTLFVAQVPIFKATARNEVKRFILLVDTLHDAGTRLVISAAAEPETLCTTGPHKAAFLRTASRLREMQSQSWWHRSRIDY